MQALLRAMRRLARHPLMQGFGDLMLRFTNLFAARFAFAGNEPRFVVPRLHRMVSSALRWVNEEGFRPRRIYDRYIALIRHAWRLQSGIFCGRRQPSPDSFCAICQQSDRRNAEWWMALHCDHCFHVGCMFTYFANETRCPLCRVELC